MSNNYYEKSGISYSMLKLLDDDPYTFYKVYIERSEVFPETSALKEGRMFDLLLTEPDKFHRIYGIKDGKSMFRGDVSESTYTRLQEMVNGLHNAEVNIFDISYSMKTLLNNGGFQEEVFWIDANSFVPCKGKLDWISSNKQIIIDFKTTRDCSYQYFSNAIKEYKYHLQAAMYCEGMKNRYAMSDFPSYFICAINKSSPYKTALYTLESEDLKQGLDLMQDLLKLYNYYNDRNWIDFF